MGCEVSRSKLDTYLDGELREEEMRSFDRHVRSCLACSAEALARTQMSRSIKAAGKAYEPSVEFRRRFEGTIASRPRHRFLPENLRSGWILAFAAVIALLFGSLSTAYLRKQSANEQVFSEIADMHVSTLASSTPVDVVSTDRHTVKPWFQGKIPFAFNLPELQNTGFSLLGGRMSYLGQAPGAQLIYDAGKHHISVFIFQERELPAGLTNNLFMPKGLSFSMESWSQDGLRYFIVGDAGADDIDRLCKLFKG
jgi:anti-sigma factor RsiW